MWARNVDRRTANLAGGDRAHQHGDAPPTQTPIEALWSAYLGTPITTCDVALTMVSLRIGRTKAGAFNLHTFAGAPDYAGVAAEVAGNNVS
jgi:hypothetical protein